MQRIEYSNRVTTLYESQTLSWDDLKNMREEGSVQHERARSFTALMRNRKIPSVWDNLVSINLAHQLENSVGPTNSDLTDLFPVRETQRRFPNLSMVDLSGNERLCFEAIRAISYLAGNLSSINLSGCSEIGDAEVYYLLTCCSNLRRLNVSKCRIKNFPLHEYSKLSSLNLSSNGGLTNASVHLIALTYSIRLKSIYLSGCPRVKEDSIISLFANCGKLELIDLSGSNEVREKLFKSLPFKIDTLRSILLSDCPEVDDDCVSKIVQKCTHLQKVHLSRTKIANRAIQALAGCQLLEKVYIDSCPNLTQIELPLAEQFGNSVLRAFTRSISFQSLTLSGNINAQTIEILSEDCPNLTSLKLIGCKFS